MVHVFNRTGFLASGLAMRQHAPMLQAAGAPKKVQEFRALADRVHGVRA